MEMTENARPIRSESARFLVNGTRHGRGVVLVYPDKIASVSVLAEIWGIALGSAAAAFAFPADQAIGVLAIMVAVWLGAMLGRAVDRKIAIRTVARGPGGVAAIPLEEVIAMRADRSAGLGNFFITETLVVTTADGTEHGFRGRTAHLQADIAGALAGLGREVRATALGLEVTPQPAVSAS